MSKQPMRVTFVCDGWKRTFSECSEVSVDLEEFGKLAVSIEDGELLVTRVDDKSEVIYSEIL